MARLSILIPGIAVAALTLAAIPLGRPPQASEPAPEFTQHAAEEWINSPPLPLKSLRGHVVLIDFWTFDCWNRYRSFP